MIRKNKRVTAVLGTAALMLLAACGSGGSDGPDLAEGEDLVLDGELIADSELLEAAQEEESVTFYTGGSEQSESALAEQFTEDTGIEVEIVRLPPNRLTERILSEQGADQLGADVMRTSGEDLTVSIAESGAFGTHRLPEGYDIAEDLVYDGGAYYTSIIRAYSIAYNDQVLAEEEAPADWEDLTDDDLRGQLGVVQVAAGGSTAALTRFQLDQLGEDYLHDLAALDPRIFDSSGGLTDAIARGEVAAGPLPMATAYSAQQDGAPIAITTPEEGAAGYAYYLGLTAEPANPNGAQILVNWLMSSTGQAASAALGDYPAREDAPAPTLGDLELPGTESGFLFTYSPEETLGNVEADERLWRDIFGYTG
ncbi:ABC transporter substrate-binding protein [Aeromicrobium sp. CTD01-1L150]|uniref:ABC transporter substrate-binding protein n=1 Tax=Aeromicrobium sp. CTD01-1L150 TaxID=3341830 RepID=UPI0035BFD8BF